MNAPVHNYAGQGLGDDGLIELSLPYNDIGPHGAEQLAGSPLIRDLQRLEFVGNDIGQTGRAALSASRFLAPGALRIDDDAASSMARPGDPDSPGAERRRASPHEPPDRP